jgi:hypothetical protein
MLQSKAYKQHSRIHRRGLLHSLFNALLHTAETKTHPHAFTSMCFKYMHIGHMHLAHKHSCLRSVLHSRCWTQPYIHTHTHKHHAQGWNISHFRYKLQNLMPSLRMRVIPDKRGIHTFSTGCTLHYQSCALIHVRYLAIICVLLSQVVFFKCSLSAESALDLQIWSQGRNTSVWICKQSSFSILHIYWEKMMRRWITLCAW